MCPRAEQMETEFITAEQRRAWGKWAKQCQTWWSCCLLTHMEAVGLSAVSFYCSIVLFWRFSHCDHIRTTQTSLRAQDNSSALEICWTSRSTLTSTRSRWGACLHADTTNSQRLINRATTRGTWLVCLLLQDNIFVHVPTDWVYLWEKHGPDICMDQRKT